MEKPYQGQRLEKTRTHISYFLTYFFNRKQYFSSFQKFFTKTGFLRETSKLCSCWKELCITYVTKVWNHVFLKNEFWSIKSWFLFEFPKLVVKMNFTMIRVSLFLKEFQMRMPFLKSHSLSLLQVSKFFSWNEQMNILSHISQCYGILFSWRITVILIYNEFSSEILQKQDTISLWDVWHWF